MNTRRSSRLVTKNIRYSEKYKDSPNEEDSCSELEHSSDEFAKSASSDEVSSDSGSSSSYFVETVGKKRSPKFGNKRQLKKILRDSQSQSQRKSEDEPTSSKYSDAAQLFVNRLTNIKENISKPQYSFQSDSDSSSEEDAKPSTSLPVTRTSDPLANGDDSKDENTNDESGFHEESGNSEYFDFTSLLSNVIKTEEKTDEKQDAVAADKRQTLKKKRGEKLKGSTKTPTKTKAKIEPGSNQMDVCELLALGEKTKISANDIKASIVKTEQNVDYKVPDKVEISLNVPGAKKKSAPDLCRALKRRLNAVKQERQVYAHQVHLLVYIAHGIYINEILNDVELLSLALSLFPSAKSYPSKHMDVSYLEELINWYRKKMPLKEPSIRGVICLESLKRQCRQLTTDNPQDQIFIFICILRAVGVKCRLVINLNTVPLKVPKTELLSLSESKPVLPDTKNQIDSAAKDNTKGKPPKTKDEKRGCTNKSSSHKERVPNKSQKTEKKDTKCEDGKDSPYFEGTSTKLSNKKISATSKKESKTPDVKSPHSKREQSASTSTKLQTDHKSNCAEKSSKHSRKDKEDNSPYFTEESLPAKRSTRSSVSNSTSSNNSEINKSQNKRVDGSHRAGTNVNSKNEENDSPYFNRDSSPSRKSTRSSRKSSNKFEVLGTPDKNTTDPKTNSKRVDEKANISKRNKTTNSSSSSKQRCNSKTSEKSSIDKKNSYDVEEMSTSDGDSDEDDSESTFKSPRKRVIDRRVLSSDEDSPSVSKKKQRVETKEAKEKYNYWIEVYLEAVESWVCVDVLKGKHHCVEHLYDRATHPMRYVLAWNNDGSIKDVTRRYAPNWLTYTRKLRVDEDWWTETLYPYKPKSSFRERREDEELEQKAKDQPLPTSISEFKNHALYVLERHLLKFQAIYPADTKPVGHVKGEAVYPRSTVHRLHGREMWIKEAKVVRLGEKPYKIVPGRQKKDRYSCEMLPPKDIELFGIWQVEDYVPPVATDGIVPRNAYGNVELFKMCMLPEGTVYLQIPDLLRVAQKLGIDCAPAVVGFDFRNGYSYPVKDGYVVCEEYQDIIVDAWQQELDERIQKERRKQRERAIKNWKHLVKLIRIQKKLKKKYNFQNLDANSEKETKKPKRKSRNV